MGDAEPCAKGYSLIGDICQPTPEGYVETRTECEMGVDSREAAGVVQNYQEELAKCRAQEKTEPGTEQNFDIFDIFYDVFVNEIIGGLTAFLESAF